MATLYDDVILDHIRNARNARRCLALPWNPLLTALLSQESRGQTGEMLTPNRRTE